MYGFPLDHWKSWLALFLDTGYHVSTTWMLVVSMSVEDPDQQKHCILWEKNDGDQYIEAVKMPIMGWYLLTSWPILMPLITEFPFTLVNSGMITSHQNKCIPCFIVLAYSWLLLFYPISDNYTFFFLFYLQWEWVASTSQSRECHSAIPKVSPFHPGASSQSVSSAFRWLNKWSEHIKPLWLSPPQCEGSCVQITTWGQSHCLLAMAFYW